MRAVLPLMVAAAGCVDEPIGDDVVDGGDSFESIAPVKISGSSSCTTATANAARKVAVDNGGTVYAVMKCGSRASVVVSTNRGRTYTRPVDLGASEIAQVAVAAGPPDVAYVALMTTNGTVSLRTTEDRGDSWTTAVEIGRATSTAAGLSLEAVDDQLFVGYVKSGIVVLRNPTRGAGGFESTTVAVPTGFFDLLYDAKNDHLLACADSPELHVRRSSDSGVTFEDIGDPVGAQYYSDWAVGNGAIYVSGTDFGLDGSSTELFVIEREDPATARPVRGLPPTSNGQTRSLAADAAGNAYVASQLGAAFVQLDRLGFGADELDQPRTIDSAGSSPIVAALPDSAGVALVYTVGDEVYATIQTY